VVFPDAWAAEAAHLRGLARTGGAAWWADRLLDGRGEPLDLAPAAILGRWLERHPARAAAAMAQLADGAALASAGPGVAGLLNDDQATALAMALARALSQRPGAAANLPPPGSPLRALLDTTLERLRRHRHVGESAATPESRLRPWRLALLLQRQPSLALLSTPALLAVVAGWGDGAQPETAPGRDAAATEPVPPPDAVSSAAPPDARDPAPTPAAAAPSHEEKPVSREGQAWIHAGGLLLLLNRPELLHPTEPPNGEESGPSAAADLALLALQRLLAPLGVGEREAALQRERPLLALLATDRVWPERLQEAVLEHPEAAERRLAALIAVIPEGVAFVPGALRQVYGSRHGAGPPLPDRESHRLAALLWRPGLLQWDRWQIDLAWPLASADGALRRLGWDLDPGWQPALRRVVRFHYRADVRPPQEEQP
jgi:hypothetical protein